MKNLFKVILACLVSLAFGAEALHAQDIAASGATSRCTEIKIFDTTTPTTAAGKTGIAHNTASFGCAYHRSNAVGSVAMTSGGGTLVAGTNGTWVSGGFSEVDSSLKPGVYQVCLPNAAFATGADYVTLTCKGAAGGSQADAMVILSPDVNVVSMDALSIPEDAFQPTGLFQTGSTTTLLNLAATETSNDITGQQICAMSGVASKDCGCVTAYNTTTKVATISPAFTNAPLIGAGYSIGGMCTSSGGSCPTAADNANAVWDALRSAHLVQGSYGEFFQAENGTAQAGAASTITLRAGASAVNDFYKGQVVQLVGGTGVLQAKLISSYVGATKVATLDSAWATTPDNTSKYVVHPFQVPTTVATTSPWDELRSAHQVQGSFGEFLQGENGTAQAGAASTITLRVGASAVDNFYNGQIIQLVGGTGVLQSKGITSYVGATKVATVDSAWATTPNNTSKYVVHPDKTVSGGGGGASWDDMRAAHVIPGSFGEGVNIGPKGLKGLSFGDDVIGRVRTAQGVSTQSVKMAASEIFASGQLKNSHAIVITSAGTSGGTSGYFEAHCICNNAGTSDTVTLCEPFTVIPTGTVQYTLLPIPGCGAPHDGCH